MEELALYATYIIGPTVVAVFIIFIWNLINARFRIEEEEHDRTKERLRIYDEKYGNEEYSDPSHLRLYYFVTDNALPAVDALTHIYEQAGGEGYITEGTEADSTVMELSKLHDSPQQYIEFAEMVELVDCLERHYRLLAEKAEGQANLGEGDRQAVRNAVMSWAHVHYLMTEAFNPIQRNPKMRKLFRHPLPHRWGDSARPDPTASKHQLLLPKEPPAKRRR